MNWNLFADAVIGALLAVAFLVAAVLLTVTGHAAPNDLWTAAFGAATFAVGATRGKAQP